MPHSTLPIEQDSVKKTTVKAHCLRSDILSEQANRSLPRIASNQINYLSLNPRPKQTPFESDGPGYLSPAGPRHDNDHIYIKDIQILPTTDEILSVTRRPYMPKKDLVEPHFLDAPMSRLLDTQFRHLRFDSTEYLRDICYVAAQKLVATSISGQSDYEAKHDTAIGNRYFMYQDAKFEEFLSHEGKGLLLRISYACPAYLRGRRMHTSGRLQQTMLCALIGIDNDDGDVSVTFFEIYAAQSTESMKSRGGKGLRAAVQLSFAQPENYSDIARTVRYAQGIATGRFVLVEFPRALYAGFYWCLKRIQEMNSTDIAFASQIAPPPITTQSRKSKLATQGAPFIFPPAYTARENFTLDMSCLTKSKVRLSSGALDPASRPSFIDFLKRETTLDEGQAVAFVESISRELAFTQGPPGTGKTFLGIALARTILASRVAQSRKPVLVVCLTNHALDSFLGGLIDAGVQNLVRFGRGSRQEWAKKHSLRAMEQKNKSKDTDIRTKVEAKRRTRGLANELEAMTKDLNDAASDEALPWRTVKSLLLKKYKTVFDQLTTDVETAAAQGFTFTYWSKGGDLENLKDLRDELEACLELTASPTEGAFFSGDDVDHILNKIAQHAEAQSHIAGTGNVWRLSLADRNALLMAWKSQVDHEALLRELIDLHFKLCEANARLKLAWQRLDEDMLSKQDVIGLTTTACASNWMLLKNLDLEVVICEEAAEVLEAHTLCTLLPSIEHAVFIGDPLQLRPQVQEQALSLEITSGVEYRLDESLFERFMSPMDPCLSAMPISKLSIQRRMHPEISAITRLTYDYLLDHEKTVDNPFPIGIYPRTYWLNHSHPETTPSQSIKSYSNQYELQMVVALLRYMIKGSGYSMGQIAVLTPYSGQLAALTKSLQSTCAVYLNEKDRAALIEEGLLEEKDEPTVNDKDDVQMSNMLRVATIDNFQGEEAKIVILSTVRSGGGPGFLKTQNRINVACSRARDGFYIIGNASTLEGVSLWKEIICLLTAQRRIGPSLMVGCYQHGRVLNVSVPADFEAVVPCQHPCGEMLPCGHTCPETCHPRELHGILKCRNPCAKKLSCGHLCLKTCHQACGKCLQIIGEKQLECGHTTTLICPGDVTPCQTVVDEVVLLCGHKQTMKCHAIGEISECEEICGARLPCGHACTRKCIDCRGGKHAPCSVRCNKLLSCGHLCDAECHSSGSEDSRCPPCRQPCRKTCPHRRCQNLCGSACDPCVQVHKALCKHRPAPSTICCLAPNTLPCNEPCEKVLKCGHLCPSLCGELCLEDRCPECLSKTFPPKFVILVPGCGHVVEVQDLDRHVLAGKAMFDDSGNLRAFDISAIPDVPTCLCGEPLGNVNRYAVITSLAQFYDTNDRLLAKVGTNLEKVCKNLHRVIGGLSSSFSAFCRDIRPNPLAAKENIRMIGDRSAGLLSLKRDLVTIRDSIISPYQESIKNLNTAYPNVIQPYRMCFRLRAELILFRIRSELIQDSFKVAQHIAPLPDPSEELARAAELLREHSMKQCMEGLAILPSLSQHASDLLAPCLEAELRLQFLTLVHFHSLISGREITISLSEEIKKLVLLCKRYPETAGRFFNTVLDYRDFLSKPREIRTISPPTIYTTKQFESDSRWAHHVLGHLTTCENNHPYSTKTFEEGCPECGKRVEFTEDAAKKYGGLLKEDRFLEWMNQV